MRHAAFTLIELLTVIAIILVLAGLLLHVAGGANTKASLARAQTEIQAMSTALESYKADNGSYPRETGTTDLLNAQGSGGTPPDVSTYKTAGQFLYRTLSGYGTVTGGTALNKAYMTFKPGQLSTGTAAPDTTTYVIDPFGIAYGYSTAGIAEQERANSATPAATPDPKKGYNPTFDLWSTGGWGTGGKPYPADVPNTSYTNLWVKNW